MPSASDAVHPHIMRLMLIYIFRAALLLVAAGFGSMFADNILEMRKLDERVKQSEAEVSKLRRQNMALIAEAHALETDPFYIELTLRRKLHWIRPGEQQIDITPRKPSAAPPAVAGEDGDQSRDGGGGDDTQQDRAGRLALPDRAGSSTAVALGGRIGLTRHGE